MNINADSCKRKNLKVKDAIDRLLEENWWSDNIIDNDKVNNVAEQWLQVLGETGMILFENDGKTLSIWIWQINY